MLFTCYLDYVQTFTQTAEDTIPFQLIFFQILVILLILDEHKEDVKVLVYKKLVL